MNPTLSSCTHCERIFLTDNAAWEPRHHRRTAHRRGDETSGRCAQQFLAMFAHGPRRDIRSFSTASGRSQRGHTHMASESAKACRRCVGFVRRRFCGALAERCAAVAGAFDLRFSDHADEAAFSAHLDTWRLKHALGVSCTQIATISSTTCLLVLREVSAAGADPLMSDTGARRQSRHPSGDRRQDTHHAYSELDTSGGLAGLSRDPTGFRATPRRRWRPPFRPRTRQCHGIPASTGRAVRSVSLMRGNVARARS